MTDTAPVEPAPARPTDAAFLPRRAIALSPAAAPATALRAKLGGQPRWLEAPTWPLAAVDGEPMTFVAQFPVPGAGARMAYLFLAQDDDCMASGYTADGGDTALIIQPGGRIPDFVATVARATGPTLWRRGPSWWDKIPVELEAELIAVEPAEELRIEQEADRQDAERAGDHSFPMPDDFATPGSYVGGRPLFWQPGCVGEEIQSPWQFFFSLDSCPDEEGSAAYWVNFGEGGTGYAFLSPDHLEGRFFWDCI